MPDMPNHISCDNCGETFKTFCDGQAHGCASGRTADGKAFGGAYGSRHDCRDYTVVDPASFPGDNVCDVCIDAMLADGRLVDGRHVNLATGEEAPIDDGDIDFAEFFYEPELLRDVAEVVEMAVEELRTKPDVPFVTGATGDAEFSVQITVHRNDEDTETQDSIDFSAHDETPDAFLDRFYAFLREQHARSSGPSQRMKDAAALYMRTVKSSLEGEEAPDVQS
jgi:hypothetical protein